MSDNTLLLQQLMDIKQTAVIFCWPLAPGWWLLILLLLLVPPGVFFFIQRYKPVRREALTELLRLEHSYLSAHDTTRFAMDISILLRRVALAKYEQQLVAGLSGNKWLGFLDAQGKTTEFTQGVGHILMDVPYMCNNNMLEDPRFNEQALIKLVRVLIRRNT